MNEEKEENELNEKEEKEKEKEKKEKEEKENDEDAAGPDEKEEKEKEKENEDEDEMKEADKPSKPSKPSKKSKKSAKLTEDENENDDDDDDESETKPRNPANPKIIAKDDDIFGNSEDETGETGETDDETPKRGVSSPSLHPLKLETPDEDETPDGETGETGETDQSEKPEEDSPAEPTSATLGLIAVIPAVVSLESTAVLLEINATNLRQVWCQAGQISAVLPTSLVIENGITAKIDEGDGSSRGFFPTRSDPRATPAVISEPRLFCVLCGRAASCRTAVPVHRDSDEGNSVPHGVGVADVGIPADHIEDDLLRPSIEPSGNRGLLAVRQGMWKRGNVVTGSERDQVDAGVGADAEARGVRRRGRTREILREMLDFRR